MYNKFIIIRWLLIGIVFFPLCASAQLLKVKLEGARIPIYLDMEKGEMFLGNDCQPFLYFKKEHKTRSSSTDTTRYFVQKKQLSRRSQGSVGPNRLPIAIELSDDGEVGIISSGLYGKARARGRVLSSQLQGRAALAKRCN
jgi:hypothetical protein